MSLGLCSRPAIIFGLVMSSLDNDYLFVGCVLPGKMGGLGLPVHPALPIIRIRLPKHYQIKLGISFE